MLIKIEFWQTDIEKAIATNAALIAAGAQPMMIEGEAGSCTDDMNSINRFIKAGYSVTVAEKFDFEMKEYGSSKGFFVRAMLPTDGKPELSWIAREDKKTKLGK